MPKPPSHAFERVYFVGAGLSAGIGYPVGSSLMAELVAYLDGEIPERHEEIGFENILVEDGTKARAAELLRVIETIAKNYLGISKKRIREIDVAEFFTITNAMADLPIFAVPENPTAPPKMRAARSDSSLLEDLAALIRTYFNETYDCCELPDDVESILCKVSLGKHAFINFNWDEELDAAFTETLDKEVEYTLEAWKSGEDEAALMLKPHGSIGWYDIKHGLGNDDLYYIAKGDDRILRSQRRIVSYLEVEGPLEINGEEEHPPLSCPPVITPPTFAKRFEYREQQLIWQDILDVCSQAREFVFLGYSMPKDDILTRAAIRGALRNNPDRSSIRCLVCDRQFDEAKRLNFQSVFKEGFTREYNYLETEFGQGEDSLGDEIETRLKEARLLI